MAALQEAQVIILLSIPLSDPRPGHFQSAYILTSAIYAENHALQGENIAVSRMPYIGNANIGS
jgi:hypothetical protein